MFQSNDPNKERDPQNKLLGLREDLGEVEEYSKINWSSI